MTFKDFTSNLLAALFVLAYPYAFSAPAFGQNHSWKTSKEKEADERAVMALALQAEDERNITHLLKYLDSDSPSPIIQERIALAWGRIGNKFSHYPPFFLS